MKTRDDVVVSSSVKRIHLNTYKENKNIISLFDINNEFIHAMRLNLFQVNVQKMLQYFLIENFMTMNNLILIFKNFFKTFNTYFFLINKYDIPCRRLRPLDPAGSRRKEAGKPQDPAGKQWK